MGWFFESMVMAILRRGGSLPMQKYRPDRADEAAE
jgi:hypothetical protein